MQLSVTSLYDPEMDISRTVQTSFVKFVFVGPLLGGYSTKASFKRRATAVPN